MNLSYDYLLQKNCQKLKNVKSLKYFGIACFFEGFQELINNIVDVRVTQESIEVFVNLREQKCSAVTFKIVKNEVVVREISNRGDIDFEQLVNRFSNSEPIYALYYISERQGYILVNCMPKSAKAGAKMMYLSSSQILKSKFSGISKVFNCIDKDELLQSYQEYIDQ